jgi:hypothetical protein
MKIIEECIAKRKTVYSFQLVKNKVGDEEFVNTVTNHR